jgi:hypothetical protein
MAQDDESAAQAAQHASLIVTMLSNARAVIMAATYLTSTPRSG